MVRIFPFCFTKVGVYSPNIISSLCKNVAEFFCAGDFSFLSLLYQFMSGTRYIHIVCPTSTTVRHSSVFCTMLLFHRVTPLSHHQAIIPLQQKKRPKHIPIHIVFPLLSGISLEKARQKLKPAITF